MAPMRPPIIGFPPAAKLEQVRRDAMAHQSKLTASERSSYAQKRRIALGAEVLDRVVIYLDTCYWIFLRDAAAGSPVVDVHLQLYQALRDGVADGKLLCPIGEGIFVELLKQDPASRQTSARVMDELSLGVAFKSTDERATSELRQFVHDTVGILDIPASAAHLVWTRVGYVLGEVVPVTPGIPANTARMLQNAFDDVLWTYGLEEIMPALSLGKPPTLDYGALAKSLNEGKFANADDIKSFRQAYLIELWGTLDAYNELLGEIMSEMRQAERGRSFGPEDRPAAGTALAQAIHAGFKYRRLAKQLPTFDILSGVHAAMRWDRQRRYKPNDWLDFRHALAAVPYSQAFFTERSLAHLLTAGDLRYADKYVVAIEHDPYEALAAVTRLAA